MAAGPSQIAERVLESLEVADVSVAGLPAKVADVVLVALGSSAAEHEELALHLARLFRKDMLSAVDAAAHRALLRLAEGPD